MQACCWRLDSLPRPGETRRASAFSTEAAGKGLSVAVGCHRLGARVDTLMAVGRDIAGEQLLQWLAGEGLDTTHIHRRGPSSGHGAGLTGADGENLIAIHAGANAALAAADIAPAAADLASADLVYGQLEIPAATVEAAFTVARRHGVRTVLNPSPWQDLPARLLAVTDVLIVNVVEAEQLFGQALPADRAGCMARIGAALPDLRQRWNGEWLVATLGAQGSIAFGRDGSCHEAAACDVEALHTVGAGDAFSAGWCVAIARGTGPLRALRIGNACAALAVARPGILPALPRAADVQDLFTAAT